MTLHIKTYIHPRESTNYSSLIHVVTKIFFKLTKGKSKPTTYHNDLNPNNYSSMTNFLLKILLHNENKGKSLYKFLLHYVDKDTKDGLYHLPINIIKLQSHKKRDKNQKESQIDATSTYVIAHLVCHG